MSNLSTTVTPHGTTSTHRALMANLATLEARNTSRCISPTSSLAISNFLLTLSTRNVIRLTTTLITFSPLLIYHTIMSIVVLFIDPTTINQISKDTNLLVTNRLLNLWTQPILKLNALGKLTIRSIIVLVKLSQFTKLSSILHHRFVPLT